MTHLVVFELHDGVEELVAGVAQPVSVLHHVGVQVDRGWETPVTNVASHILVIWKEKLCVASEAKCEVVR